MSASPASPLDGQTLFVSGRIQGVTRRRLDQLVRLRGGKLVAKPTARVTLIAVGHSAAANVLPDGHIRLPAGLPDTAILISEPSKGETATAGKRDIVDMSAVSRAFGIRIEKLVVASEGLRRWTQSRALTNQMLC